MQLWAFWAQFDWILICQVSCLVELPVISTVHGSKGSNEDFLATASAFFFFAFFTRKLKLARSTGFRQPILPGGFYCQCRAPMRVNGILKNPVVHVRGSCVIQSVTCVDHTTLPLVNKSRYSVWLVDRLNLRRNGIASGQLTIVLTTITVFHMGNINNK